MPRRRWLSKGWWIRGAWRARARDRVDGDSHGGNRPSRIARGAGGGRDREEAWRVAALRAIGSLGLVFFFAVAALWFFAFRGMAWQGLLSPSLGGFLLSWIAAVRGVEGRECGRRTGAAISVGPEVATGLARCGFFLGVLGFVAFFFVAYR